jgi:hypothetical protein
MSAMAPPMTKEQLLRWADEVQRENRAVLKATTQRRENLELAARLSERIVEQAIRTLRTGR